MNNKTQEALKMAIDTMEMHVPYYVKDRGCDAINACEEALEQQEIGDAEINQMLNDIEYYQKRVEALEQPAQEPVGVVSWHEGTVMGSIFPSNNMPKDGEFLYIYPVQTLMDDDCREIAEENFKLGYETCKKNQPAQEDEIKALKEKNNG